MEWILEVGFSVGFFVLLVVLGFFAIINKMVKKSLCSKRSLNVEGISRIKVVNQRLQGFLIF